MAQSKTVTTRLFLLEYPTEHATVNNRMREMKGSADQCDQIEAATHETVIIVYEISTLSLEIRGLKG